MAKSGTKIWFGRMAEGSRQIMRRSLADLSRVIGIPYSTAKRRASRDGGKVVFVKKNSSSGAGDEVWEVWLEEVI